MPSSSHPNARLAAIVRTCSTKKELQAAGLKGERLDTAWQWLQLRHKRLKTRDEAVIDNCLYRNLQSWYLTPRPVDNGGPESDYRSRHYTAKWIKPEFRRQVFYWPWASNFSYSFAARIARRLKVTWPYHWDDKNYSIHLGYLKQGVEVKGSRSASAYDTYYVTLSYNLLTHEAVVIGGMLTIRAKADAHLDEYPCIWLERNVKGPGLYTVRGRITARNHHIVEDPAILGKKASTQFNRKLARLRSTPPIGSPWVTREISLAAGNCERGTDNFIRNTLTPWLKKNYGGSYFPGLCLHIKALLALKNDHFTQRIAKFIRSSGKPTQTTATAA